MIERLRKGDSVTFAVVNGGDSTRIRGPVRERAGNYVRITVTSPKDHPNVTIVAGDDYGPGITVCRDYSMEVLGTAPYVNVVTKDNYKTVIHAN